MFDLRVGLKRFITSLKNYFNPTRGSNTSHKTNYLSFFFLLNQTLNVHNWHLFCVLQSFPWAFRDFQGFPGLSRAFPGYHGSFQLIGPMILLLKKYKGILIKLLNMILWKTYSKNEEQLNKLVTCIFPAKFILISHYKNSYNFSLSKLKKSDDIIYGHANFSIIIIISL